MSDATEAGGGTRRAALRLANVGLVIGALVSAAALLAPTTWVGELAASLRWHAGVGFGVLAAVLVLCRSVVRLGVALGFMVVHLGALWPLSTAPPPGGETAASFDLAVINVLYDNRAHADVDAWLRATDADVVAVVESSAAWLDYFEAEGVLGRYPHQHVERRPGPFGISLYSRYPLTRAVTQTYGPLEIPFIDADVDVDGCVVQLVAAHTYPPVSPTALAMRDGLLTELGEVINVDRPAVLAGDLNATWYALSLRRLLEVGLHDARVGAGRTPTWRPRLGPFGLDLDRILGTRSVRFSGFSVGPNVGSDHAGMRVRVAVDASACR